MAHKVGQKGNSIEICQKVFGKTVPGGVGIDDLWVQAVPDREYLELSTYARWGDGSVKTAEEQGTGASVGGGQPFLQFMNQSAGNIARLILLPLVFPGGGGRYEAACCDCRIPDIRGGIMPANITR